MPGPRERRTTHGSGFFWFLVFLCLVLFSGVPASAVEVDRDGKDDITVYRPTTGVWYILQSSDGYNPILSKAHSWGGPEDIPVPGDFDFDGKTDIAVYRPTTGVWYILQSSDGYNPILSKAHSWGGPEDIPVPGDFDSDGKTDIAVYRPTTGVWYILQSSDGYNPILSKAHSWGGPEDIPVPGDFDGDGKTDIAVYRPTTGVWYILQSSDGYNPILSKAHSWGGPEDIPVPGDFDSDGKTDIAVYRPTTGVWYILQSSDGYNPILSKAHSWGGPEDIPVPGDFDGDGKTDIAVYRPTTGVWYILQSSDGYNPILSKAYSWGGGTDISLRGRLGRRAFWQGDLTGNWDLTVFETGNHSSWVTAVLAVDSAGNATYTSYLNSDGVTTPPGGFNTSIDPGGTVTIDVSSAFHGTMSPDKTLIVATDTTSSNNNFTLSVARKRVAGVTYGASDLQNIPFAYYGLTSGGGDNTWRYGDGGTNGSGQITFDNCFVPSGRGTCPSGDTFQIDPNGRVTRSSSPNFHGVMTPDKKVIFATATDNAVTGTYRFIAFLVTGQTYVQSDVAGVADYHHLESGTSALWSHGTFTNDLVGNSVYSSHLDSTGNTTLPGPYIVTIDSTGAITRSSSTSFHGHMDYNKNLSVRVQNQGTGTYGFSINLRRK